MQKKAEAEAKRKEAAKLAAMDPQQQQEYEDQQAKSSAHDLAKSSHYERLGRMSVQVGAATGRGGRGRGGRGNHRIPSSSNVRDRTPSREAPTTSM